MTSRLLCFGLGYSARYLAARLRRRGWSLVGTCRTPESTAALSDAGIEPLLFDGRQPVAQEAFAGVTHVLSSVPPDHDGDPAFRLHRDWLDAHAGTLAWIGYLSTTGVYGDTAGGWVDETSPLAPSNDRSQWRVVAEQQWLGLWQGHGAPVHVFRLPGIYGPGRSAIDQVRAGTARRIDKPGQVFSRIHVEDIAATLAASIEKPRGGALYNVADDEPAPNALVIAHAFELLGQPVPPAIPYDRIAPSLTPMARSFYADSRRVRNRLIKQELGVQLTYPTYREGLRAILAAAPVP
ncbi:MAG: SDR family oxidoreductase [Alphaproteobacteria bacterium]|nr:SDR family oxidoreductase [Alphaproteobacteria bacterium]MCW5740719.1 SDR family oxidoreductase [Alphaproteobacteria bacterium]